MWETSTDVFAFLPTRIYLSLAFDLVYSHSGTKRVTFTRLLVPQINWPGPGNLIPVLHSVVSCLPSEQERGQRVRSLRNPSSWVSEQGWDGSERHDGTFTWTENRNSPSNGAPLLRECTGVLGFATSQRICWLSPSLHVFLFTVFQGPKVSEWLYTVNTHRISPWSRLMRVAQLNDKSECAFWQTQQKFYFMK